jgi:hypothetical protein
VLSIWRGFLLSGLRRKGPLFTHLSQRLSSAVLPFGVPIDIGPKGPKMTWAQRAKAGIPAEKFQAALAAESNA